MNNQELVKRDLQHIWHPCTQMKDHERLPMVPIRCGKGVWLEDFEGNRYLDAISSWWVNLFGHCHPGISSAIARQAESLEHVLLAGFTHEPAITLAERLATITPPGLERCFFADNGSSAVEVALKMSFHYWKNRGKAGKTRYISLSNSYHGETLGALAAGQVKLYKDTYAPLLMDVISAPSPDCFFRDAGESCAEYSARRFADMRAILEHHAHEVCAVIIEPLVQCAGNMRMYDPVYLKLLREACNEFGVHLIADEIATGFGRTGTMFGCEQADISPDFMCLSKGLTGGYLPLSAVLTTQQIYDAFYDEYENLNAFLHSHSYTGNALACAAALATLEVFDTDDVIGENRTTAARILTRCEPLNDHPHVAEVRQTGMITAIEMVEQKLPGAHKPFDWKQRRGLRVYEHALTKGVLLRPLGNVVYFMPPYVINDNEIDLMTQTAIEGIELATRTAQ